MTANVGFYQLGTEGDSYFRSVRKFAELHMLPHTLKLPVLSRKQDIGTVTLTLSGPGGVRKEPRRFRWPLPGVPGGDSELRHRRCTPGVKEGGKDERGSRIEHQYRKSAASRKAARQVAELQDRDLGRRSGASRAGAGRSCRGPGPVGLRGGQGPGRGSPQLPAGDRSAPRGANRTDPGNRTGAESRHEPEPGGGCA